MRISAGIIAVIALLFCCTPPAIGKILNIEFKFTPFTGDAAKNNEVTTVAGKAVVFINNVPMAEQPVQKQVVPVLFAEREITPSVWVPASRLGPRLRKGKNTIRIEFEPANIKTPYSAQLRWASVTDQVSEKSQPGKYQATNQSGEGVDTKQPTGKVVFEREFAADFAADLPWHHYPPVTKLDDQDKQRLAAFVKDRANAFKPDFAGVYQLLKGVEGLSVTEMKKAKCLDKAYAAGARISAPAADQIEFIMTGNPEVVVQRKGGELYTQADPMALERIKGEEAQMCAGVALSVAYPPSLVVVRTPAGDWELVY